jgi:hypothetical protein
MRNLTFLSFLWFFACLYPQLTHGQRMLIKSTDGTESVRSLSLTSKITFSNDALVLTEKTESEEIKLQGIFSLKFKNELSLSAKDINISSSALSIYPNPARETVYVQNLSTEYVAAKVYNLYGRLLVQTKVNAGNNAIQVDCLPQGIYVIQINNKGLKFQKL